MQSSAIRLYLFIQVKIHSPLGGAIDTVDMAVGADATLKLRPVPPLTYQEVSGVVHAGSSSVTVA